MSDELSTVDFLSTKEVAELLGVKEITVRHWRRTKHPRRHAVTLPWYRIGGKVMYRRVEVMRFIEQARTIPPVQGKSPEGNRPMTKGK